MTSETYGLISEKDMQLPVETPLIGKASLYSSHGFCLASASQVSTVFWMVNCLNSTIFLSFLCASLSQPCLCNSFVSVSVSTPPSSSDSCVYLSQLHHLTQIPVFICLNSTILLRFLCLSVSTPPSYSDSCVSVSTPQSSSDSCASLSTPSPSSASCVFLNPTCLNMCSFFSRSLLLCQLLAHLLHSIAFIIHKRNGSHACLLTGAHKVPSSQLFNRDLIRIGRSRKAHRTRGAESDLTSLPRRSAIVWGISISAERQSELELWVSPDRALGLVREKERGYAPTRKPPPHILYFAHAWTYHQGQHNVFMLWIIHPRLDWQKT